MNFDELAAAKVITPGGAAWLKIATDPFHDHKVSGIEGYPDMNATDSIVRLGKASVVCAAPTAASWDLCIHFTPTPSFATVRPVSSEVRQHVTVDAGGTPMNYGWITYVAVPTGAAFAPQSVVAAAGGYSGVMQHVFIQGADRAPYRMIAGGVEVVNKTAEMYKGGSVTCAARPTVLGERSLRVTSGANTFYCQAREYAGIPTTLAVVDSWVEARKSEARDGLYVPIRFNSPDQYPTIECLNPIYYYGSAVNYITDVNADGAAYLTMEKPPNVNGWTAVFTGLDPNASLEINSRVWYEKFPMDLSVDTDREAVSPSAKYDPAALAIYAALVKKLPISCAQTDNPSGEWFKMVLSTLGTVMKSVAPALALAVPEAAPFAPMLAIAGQAIETSGRRAPASGTRAAPPPSSKKKKAAKKK